MNKMEKVKQAYFENYKKALREMENYFGHRGGGGFWVAVFDNEISSKMTSTTSLKTKYPFISVFSWSVFNGVSEYEECEDESCDIKDCFIDAEGNHTSREEWIDITLNVRAKEWFEKQWRTIQDRVERMVGNGEIEVK